MGVEGSCWEIVIVGWNQEGGFGTIEVFPLKRVKNPGLSIQGVVEPVSS